MEDVGGSDPTTTCGVVEMIKYSITKALKPGQWADPCFHTMLVGPYIDCPGLEVLVIDMIFY